MLHAYTLPMQSIIINEATTVKYFFILYLSNLKTARLTNIIGTYPVSHGGIILDLEMNKREV